MIQIPLKQKYLKSQVKKQSASGDDQGRGSKKKVRRPAPVVRIRTLHLVEGRKLRFEG